MLDEIKEAAQDILSLDVTTVTGKIDITATSGKIDIKKLHQAITDNGKMDAKLNVVAYTHVDFDSDSFQYIKEGLTESETPHVMAHNEMVKTAQEARMSVIVAIKELVGL